MDASLHHGVVQQSCPPCVSYDLLPVSHPHIISGFAGVLSKLDIMDRGTNASHILRNQLIPLRLGYVGVVNRCQEDINQKLSMAAARK